MGEHHQVLRLRKLHQAARDGAVGIGAVIEVEFADAAIGAGGRAPRQLRLHHLMDASIAEPAAVVGAVAIQPNERHHRHARRGGLAACRGEASRAVVGAAVGDDRAHAAALHAGEHVGQRMRVLRLVVVVQVGVEQRADVRRLASVPAARPRGRGSANRNWQAMRWSMGACLLLDSSGSVGRHRQPAATCPMRKRHPSGSSFELEFLLFPSLAHPKRPIARA